MRTFKSFICLLCLLMAQTVWSEPKTQLVKVIVSPDHADWLYKTNEKVTFNIQVIRHNVLLKGVKIDYELGPEMYPVEKKQDMTLKEGTLTLSSKMKEPGFLRCTVRAKVDGQTYEGMATAGIEPNKIKATTVNPADFDHFWGDAIAEARKTPLDPQMVLIPERCTETMNIYSVSFQNVREGSRTYGILCLPKKEGRYPAVLRVPGAGIRPYYGDTWTAGKNVITLEIGIHGIPVDNTQDYYDKLFNGALFHYWEMNSNDRDAFYYKRVYLACIRANDFICSLPAFNGKELGVTGSSQGGALSIVTAALDPRVTFLAVFHPAMCDLSASLQHRADGWPHYFYNEKSPRPNELETSRYYDTVNFARRLKAKGWYSWGYNDNVCPPTSTHAAYNEVTAPKEFMPCFDTGHWWYPEQYEICQHWMWKQLGVE